MDTSVHPPHESFASFNVLNLMHPGEAVGKLRHGAAHPGSRRKCAGAVLTTGPSFWQGCGHAVTTACASVPAHFIFAGEMHPGTLWSTRESGGGAQCHAEWP